MIAYMQRILYLIAHPSQEMIEAGVKAIHENTEVVYVSGTAPKSILDAMIAVALKQAEHG